MMSIVSESKTHQSGSDNVTVFGEELLAWIISLADSLAASRVACSMNPSRTLSDYITVGSDYYLIASQKGICWRINFCLWQNVFSVLLLFDCDVQTINSYRKGTHPGLSSRAWVKSTDNRVTEAEGDGDVEMTPATASQRKTRTLLESFIFF